MMHTSVIDFDTCGQLIHASQDRLYRLAYATSKTSMTRWISSVRRPIKLWFRCIPCSVPTGLTHG